MARAKKNKKPKAKRPGKAGSSPIAHGPETMEFHREFQAHTDSILRNRLLWFIGIWGGLGVLTSLPLWAVVVDQMFGFGWFADDFAEALRGFLAIGRFAIIQALWTVAYAAALILTIKGSLTRPQAVWVSVALVATDGLYGIALRASGMDMGAGLLMFTMSHIIAALVFPWTARQAALPAVIVLSVNALSLFLLEEGTVAAHAIAASLTPLIALPGCLIAWARYSRRLGQYRLTFVQKNYGKLRQELAYARTIHESMFPHPRTGKNINFTYKYEPMRQIGGDYLFASHCPTDNGDDESLSIVLLDVTGHGIPAALTVNRLHGEIELLFADNPFIDPGEVLSRLNRYVHLTLARHSIFVTAICLKADPHKGILKYASGGHPPAFLRAVDGAITDLDSTAFVLGACADTDFDPAEKSIGFGPGDSVITYTDGATEARQESGQMLRIGGMRRLLAARERVEPGLWPARLLEAVTSHREGLPPEDDTLVVEIYRDLRDTRTEERPRIKNHDATQTGREAQPAGHHSPAS